jgi:putative ABC transport system permease protein
MKTPLAWHNLWHKPVRSGVAVMGVTFAAVLMFMQLGFLEAVKASATVIYDVLDFDICIRSRDYDHFSDARTFDRSRLADAEGVRGVGRIAPLLVGVFSWRNPDTGEPRAILALGVPEAQPLFRDPAIQTKVDDDLQRPQSMLIDTLTRHEFGPTNGRRFGPADIGRKVEINGKSLTIAGHFTRGAGLNAGGAVIMSQRDFQRCAPQLASNPISLALVRANHQTDSAVLAEQLRRTLPRDVEVLTRDEVLSDEVRHWVWETNYGLIFQSGVLVAVIVGAAIVYQVLASDVASLMPEYATLKAMGYGNQYLRQVMVEQSMLLALVAYLAGVLIALVLYEITAAGAQIPVRMTSTNLLLVLALTVAICVASALAAVRKAFRADPAELY